jgi:hypothetical protein
VTDNTPEYGEERQGLIDELQSLSATLGPPAPGVPMDADIPVLLEVVELPPTAPGAAADALGASSAAPAGIDVDAAMQVEAGFILEELMDEFLPLVEARLRERLEERMRHLLAAAER